MTQPNLFIVGAAKAGTSSLWQYLKQNRQIFMPDDELYKEPCFFSAYGERMGLAHYMKLFEKTSKSHKYAGEASAVYLTDPSSAQRIFDFNRDARIIIMLRNPADRAYSLYNWMVQDGYEYARTFEEALDLEDERRNKLIPNWFEPQYYWNFMYFQSGLYYSQVKRYLELFRENVLLTRFDDFKKDLAHTYKRICSFLGIEVNEISAKIYNPSKSVFSARIQFLLRKLNSVLIELVHKGVSQAELESSVRQNYSECTARLSEVADFTLTEKMRCDEILRCAFSLLKNNQMSLQNIATKDQRDQLLTLGFNAKRLPGVKCETKNRLLRQYAGDIERLSDLTHFDFSDWMQPSRKRISDACGGGE
jgi:hypothetical protein